MRKKRNTRFQPFIDDPNWKIRDTIEGLHQTLGRTKKSLVRDIFVLGLNMFEEEFTRLAAAAKQNPNGLGTLTSLYYNGIKVNCTTSEAQGNPNETSSKATLQDI